MRISSLRNLIIVIPSMVFSCACAMASTLEQAAQIEITPHGLRQISTVIKNSLGEQIKGELNTEVAAEYGPLKVTDADMEYSFKINSLTISGANNALNAGLTVGDVRIHVRSFKIKARTVIGSTRFTCKDLVVKFAHGRDLNSRSKLRLEIKEGQFSSVAEENSLDVDRKDYEVQGPRSCTGDVGVGEIVKLLVRSIADKAFPRIVKELTKKLDAVAVDFGVELNKITKKQLSVNYAMVGASDFSQAYAVVPEAIRISEQGLMLTMGMTRIQNDFAKRLSSVLLKSNVEHTETLATDEKILLDSENVESQETALRLSLNPGLLEYFLQPALASGRLNINLSSAEHVAVRELLQPHQAANIWPDLLRRQLVDPLGLNISFTQVPRLLGNADASDKLTVEVPAMNLQFMLPSGGSYTPYFTMRTSLRAPLQLQINQSQLKLGINMPSAPELSLSGDFEIPAEDLNPSFFEDDMAHAILRSSLDYLYNSGSIADVALPQWQLGNLSLGIKSAAIVDGKIKIELSL